VWSIIYLEVFPCHHPHTGVFALVLSSLEWRIAVWWRELEKQLLFWRGCYCGLAQLIADLVGINRCSWGSWLQTNGLYYRGESIWEAVIAELLSKGMDKVDKVCNWHLETLLLLGDFLTRSFYTSDFMRNLDGWCHMRNWLGLNILFAGPTWWVFGRGLVLYITLWQVQGCFARS
jgi:hypothetical protein